MVVTNHESSQNDKKWHKLTKLPSTLVLKAFISCTTQAV